MDGYPNYRYLEAINNNLTQSYIDSSASSIKSLLDLLRWF